MRYQIIVSDEIELLEDDVNLELKKGWQPLGGVVVESAPYSYDNAIDGKGIETKIRYLQTLVHKAKVQKQR